MVVENEKGALPGKMFRSDRSYSHPSVYAMPTENLSLHNHACLAR